MKLEYLSREGMIQKAKFLISCLEEKADEDAFCHLMDLIWSLHRSERVELIEVKNKIKEICNW